VPINDALPLKATQRRASHSVLFSTKLYCACAETRGVYTIHSLPWQAGKPLTWDVTVVRPLADSYVAAAAREAGSVAELTAARKSAKHTNLDSG